MLTSSVSGTGLAHVQILSMYAFTSSAVFLVMTGPSLSTAMCVSCSSSLIFYPVEIVLDFSKYAVFLLKMTFHFCWKCNGMLMGSVVHNSAAVIY